MHGFFENNSFNPNNERSTKLLDVVKEKNELLNCSFMEFDLADEQSKDRIFKNELIAKETVISESNQSSNNTRPSISISTPIQRNGEISDILIFDYPLHYFDEVLDVDFFDRNGEVFVVDSEGKIIIGHSKYFNDSNNFFDSVMKGNAIIETGVHTKNNNKESGIMLLQLNSFKEPFYLTYERLVYNNWYVIGIVNESAALYTFDGILSTIEIYFVIVISMLLIFALLCLLVVSSENRNRDKMTGCYTLRKFKNVAKKYLRKNGFGSYIFIKIDIKDFKIINFSYGFDAGNKVILTMASALKEVVVEEEGGLMCRAGTDEFILLLKYKENATLEAEREKFIKVFKEKITNKVDIDCVFPTGQLIINYDNQKSLDLEIIIENVNYAHRKAKLKSRNVVIDYDEDILAKEMKDKYILAVKEKALESNNFKLYLQPKVSTKDYKLCGAEALVRWEDDYGKIFKFPNEFIPIFEECGFIVRLDMYIFEEAVKYLKKLKDEGSNLIKISVNFSRRHIGNQYFASRLNEITTKYGVSNQYLEIEITESVDFEDFENIDNFFTSIHQFGFSLALDDFGTGYSSLVLLKNLQVDVIKLDREFFIHENNIKRGNLVVKEILRLAHILDIETVAEGVETLDKVEMLKKYGCNEIQGYYFYQPMNLKDFDIEFHRVNNQK